MVAAVIIAVVFAVVVILTVVSDAVIITEFSVPSVGVVVFGIVGDEPIDEAKRVLGLAVDDGQHFLHRALLRVERRQRHHQQIAVLGHFARHFRRLLTGDARPMREACIL